MSFLIQDCRIAGADADSILIEGGFIRQVSSGLSREPPDSVVRIDARGATVLPGLTDTHCHPFELAWLRRSVDLRGAANISNLRFRLSSKVRAAPEGTWILGMGWDQEEFTDGRLPAKEDIDDLAPMNPVMLLRVCGHIALLNSRAMEVLGLGEVRGEEYQRDAGGALTGIIKEQGLDRAFAAVPRDSVETVMEGLVTVEYEAARSGLTTLHCILSPDGFPEELDAIVRLRSEGRLALRYRLYVPPRAVGYIAEKKLRARLDDDRVRISGVKIFADGSLGARTAALRAPYSDDPGNSGMLRYGDRELGEAVREADAQGYQVIVHAIGDRAIEQAIDALSAVTSARNEKRHRIEHASLAPKDLRARMKRHSIGVAVQPHFIVSDRWAGERLGEERVADLYPLKSMLREGLVVSGGSDAPVEPMSPILGVWAAMVRAGFAPDERLDLAEAISLYTTNAALNGDGESDKAGIVAGHRADLVVLDSDIGGMHPAMLRKVGIAATVANGRVVFSYEGIG